MLRIIVGFYVLLVVIVSIALFISLGSLFEFLKVVVIAVLVIGVFFIVGHLLIGDD